ncbi:MAG: NIP7 N-terminal domain-related protein [Candidatus Hydrothermarchaeales archaeon]
MKFKRLEKKEFDALKKLKHEFGVDLEKILDDKVLFVALDGRKEVFATNKQASEALEKLKRDPYSIGLYLGEIRGGRFILSLEGASVIARYTDKKVIVSRKAEQLVLYGRDVFSKSAVNFETLAEGERCLIVNDRDELLGIGRVEKGMVKNLMDRGWYLRKGE